MRLLMVTRADDSVKEYADYTIPILRNFAKKWNADFRILDDSLGTKIKRKLALYKIFESYDRMLHLDSDLVINKNCPNVFDIVPFDTIGLVLEDKGSRLRNRRKRIEYAKNILGDIKHWTKDYFNMGFFVVSSIHREIFTKIDGKLWGVGQKIKLEGADQTHLCYQIMKQKHKYIDLGFKFNHMSMFSEAWNGRPSRFNSYIIHYAGQGAFPGKGNRSRAQLIKDDIRRIYG